MRSNKSSLESPELPYLFFSKATTISFGAMKELHAFRCPRIGAEDWSYKHATTEDYASCVTKESSLLPALDFLGDGAVFLRPELRSSFSCNATFGPVLSLLKTKSKGQTA